MKLIRKKKRTNFCKVVEAAVKSGNTASVWKLFNSCKGNKPPPSTSGDLQVQINLVKKVFKGYSRPDNPVDTADSILTSKTKASPGPDGIPNAIWKILPDRILIQVLRVINRWFDSGIVPSF